MNNGKKFDIAIMNPPYGSLAIKFLNKIIDISHIAVTIQPSNWLFGNNKNEQLLEKIKNIYINTEKIPNPGKYFIAGGAAIGNDLGINYINDGMKGFLINDKLIRNIDTIRRYTGDELIEEFEKILGGCIQTTICVSILKNIRIMSI